MLIFGNSYIESPRFVSIKAVADIDKTSPKDILYIQEFTPPYNLAKHCAKNNLVYAVAISSVKDALFANAFKASYCICNKELASEVQNIAQEYLWDLKVLAVISDDNELETIAKASIDGVIYQNYLKD